MPRSAANLRSDTVSTSATGCSCRGTARGRRRRCSPSTHRTHHLAVDAGDGTGVDVDIPAVPDVLEQRAAVEGSGSKAQTFQPVSAKRRSDPPTWAPTSTMTFPPSPTRWNSDRIRCTSSMSQHRSNGPTSAGCPLTAMGPSTSERMSSIRVGPLGERRRGHRT